MDPDILLANASEILSVVSLDEHASKQDRWELVQQELTVMSVKLHALFLETSSSLDEQHAAILPKIPKTRKECSRIENVLEGSDAAIQKEALALKAEVDALISDPSSAYNAIASLKSSQSRLMHARQYLLDHRSVISALEKVSELKSSASNAPIPITKIRETTDALKTVPLLLNKLTPLECFESLKKQYNDAKTEITQTIAPKYAAAVSERSLESSNTWVELLHSLDADDVITNVYLDHRSSLITSKFNEQPTVLIPDRLGQFFEWYLGFVNKEKLWCCSSFQDPTRMLTTLIIRSWQDLNQPLSARLKNSLNDTNLPHVSGVVNMVSKLAFDLVKTYCDSVRYYDVISAVCSPFYVLLVDAAYVEKHALTIKLDEILSVGSLPSPMTTFNYADIVRQYVSKVPQAMELLSEYLNKALLRCGGVCVVDAMTVVNTALISISDRISSFIDRLRAWCITNGDMSAMCKREGTSIMSTMSRGCLPLILLCHAFPMLCERQEKLCVSIINDNVMNIVQVVSLSIDAWLSKVLENDRYCNMLWLLPYLKTRPDVVMALNNFSMEFTSNSHVFAYASRATRLCNDSIQSFVSDLVLIPVNDSCVSWIQELQKKPRTDTTLLLPSYSLTPSIQSTNIGEYVLMLPEEFVSVDDYIRTSSRQLCNVECPSEGAGLEQVVALVDGVIVNLLNPCLSSLSPVALKQLSCDCANVCSAIGAKRVPDLQLIESYCNDNVPKDSDNLTTIE